MNIPIDQDIDVLVIDWTAVDYQHTRAKTLQPTDPARRLQTPAAYV